MTELAKCRCVAAADLRGALNHVGSGFRVSCPACMLGGPWKPSEPEAIAAWNDLMRPRPVAEWVSGEHVQSLSLGSVDLGNVVRMATRVPAWKAWAAIAEQVSPPFPDPRPARAWLEERVRAQGFEVKETTDA